MNSLPLIRASASNSQPNMAHPNRFTRKRKLCNQCDQCNEQMLRVPPLACSSESVSPLAGSLSPRIARSRRPRKASGTACCRVKEEVRGPPHAAREDFQAAEIWGRGQKANSERRTTGKCREAKPCKNSTTPAFRIGVACDEGQMPGCKVTDWRALCRGRQGGSLLEQPGGKSRSSHHS